MKYTDKDYKKFNIDLSNCYTFDDVVVATVKGSVENGAPISVYMLCEYDKCMMHNTIKEMFDAIFSVGNTIYFSNDGVKVTNTEPIKLNDGESVRVENGNVVIKKASLIKRFWNWITRKNK